MVSTNCVAPNCDVENRYDESKSKTVVHKGNVPVTQNAFIFASNHIVEDSLTATAINEYTKIQLYEYGREVVVNITMANVLGA